MRTIRAHSRAVVFLFFAVAVGAAGLAWWLFDGGDTPTNAQVIADACADAEAAEFGTTNIQVVPDPPGGSMTLEFTQTEVRFRVYDGGVMIYEAIVITTTPPAGARSTRQYTRYEHHLEDNNQWSEWRVEDKEETTDIPDIYFCGFTSDQLSDLQYVGSETVKGISTSHYSATLEPHGDSWEMWVGADGRPVKTVTTDSSGVSHVATYSDDEPTITAPVVSRTP